MSLKSIADVIQAAAPAMGDVKAFLVAQRAALLSVFAQFPDSQGILGPRIADLDAKIALLDTVVDPARLADLGFLILKELAQVPTVGLQPHPAPGDVTGG